MLDTCAVQGLREVMHYFDDGGWRLGARADLFARYGERKGKELIALGNVAQFFRRGSPPWLVSQTSFLEFERANPGIAHELLNWWAEWADCMQASADNYEDLELRLLFENMPLVHSEQMRLPFVVPSTSPIDRPAIPPFKDRGDCSLIRDALRAGVSMILTLDLRSFWCQRRYLAAIGIGVWRPVDYWEALRPQQASAWELPA